MLDPITGGGAVPRQWGEVYSEHLLATTSRTLAGIQGGTISIPDDVQHLVEAVHGNSEDFDWNNPGGSETKAWTAHKGKEMAERSMAGLLAVPAREAFPHCTTCTTCPARKTSGRCPPGLAPTRCACCAPTSTTTAG
ncbi:hypothetical protein ACFQV4_25555 [Streptomyces thermocarboxydus]